MLPRHAVLAARALAAAIAAGYLTAVSIQAFADLRHAFAAWTDNQA